MPVLASVVKSKMPMLSITSNELVRFASVAPPRKRKTKDRRSNKRVVPVGAPEFKDVYRQFMSKVHPDLFTKYPEMQEVNEASL